MEELKLTPQELKMAIRNGKYIGSGFFGTTFLYKNRLIKLDTSLYCLLNNRNNKKEEEIIEDYYEKPKDDFTDRLQIEELTKKQKDITLTKLPEGIVTLKDMDARIMKMTPGIIIPYHEKHHKLEMIKRNDYKKLLIILKRLLCAVRELADNKIAQEDFGKYDYDLKRRNTNILYKDAIPQIIDMEGRYVKVGKAFSDASMMYNSLGEVILDYFTYNHLESPYRDYDIENDSQIELLLKELEKQMKGKER